MGVLVLAFALVGCTAAEASITGNDVIVVGVKSDQPRLGFKENDRFTGFEVDVGTYIARHIGASKVEFREVRSDNREKKLDEGAVDLVLASYSITPDRAKLVTFGGPYYVAHQDVMVRRGETRIRGVRDLAGRRMCQASGSVSTERVVVGLSIPAKLVPGSSYSDCVAKLRGGQVDAVSTGDLVLAGFAAPDLEIVNSPFTDEHYGVGMRKGDIDGCEAVNKAITTMYQDGTASELLRKWFGPSGLKLVEEVPQFEGCS
ncbi:glutamate ABC transporter substrate-binding protein [Actinomadura sp. KC345]|jgi:glutamate transport system substrate-binding protein|uniref:glutamate ABC transporter substrate-binding protein n=1 Tax=Actinomadura sp. KC345 TaxID=2530371 RepID=UPI001051B9D7|nr:glutamate ABC transporter substrate-binding protein [Actinomadura sp. KC345]TDC56226.1 glutamate ABC transporter substrate-binding protein [Actinomadura sp. KC345]